MKKLIDELEKELEKIRDNGKAHAVKNGLQRAISIVRAHNPWHEGTELPPEHEKVLVQYGDENDGNVLMGIMDSENRWSIFYSDGLKAEEPNRPIVKWAYLPEANK